jgi:hypothetical protein
MEYVLSPDAFKEWYWWCKRHSTLLLIIVASSAIAYNYLLFLGPMKSIRRAIIYSTLFVLNLSTGYWAIRHLVWFHGESWAVSQVVQVILTLSLVDLSALVLARQRTYTKPIKAGVMAMSVLGSAGYSLTFLLVTLFPVLVCIYF